jgi:hypothetical protein
MKFSEVFVIVNSDRQGCSFNERIYTTYTEAVDEVIQLRSKFEWLDLVVISLAEYNDERWSFGYDEGYDNRDNQ